MIRVAPQVEAALADRQPVVALESTLISHGLPRPINIETARAMVARWGMSPEVGMLAIDSRESGDFLNTGPNAGSNAFSEETARQVDAATRRIIDESYATAIELLTHHRHRLEALTQALLREDSLNLDQMLAATGLSRERSKEEAPLAVALGDG